MASIKEPAREGFLYQIWMERPFAGKKLLTTEKKPIEIREKGIRNYDAGPDFLDALIAIEGQLLRGDVEIHPVAGDWYMHQHHKDPRYNRVVLHVVTMHCPSEFRTLAQDGRSIATLNLDDYLEKSAEDLEADSETTPKSRDELYCGLKKVPTDAKKRVLEAAGDLRLELKTQQFRESRQLDSWEQIFYYALFDALGFSKNRTPFRTLAQQLPVETLWSYIWNDPVDLALLKSEAFLFGVAGLLPVTGRVDDSLPLAELEYPLQLVKIWSEFPLLRKVDPLKPAAWQFFRLRPQNFPTRRLAAAARLVVRFLEDGFAETFRRTIQNCERQPLKAARELEKLFLIPASPYWASHYSFDDSHLDAAAGRDQLMLGAERARDILINVVLPGMLAFAEESSDGRLQNSLREIYRQYPCLAENEITQLMRDQVFSMVETAAPVIDGVRSQQGLIHLHKSLCSPPVCDRCLSLG